MDADGLEKLKAFDAIYLGAVGYPGVPDHISLWDLLLTIRKGFDQYVNLRPVKLLDGAPCPLKDVERKDVDMLFVRENSEGEYAGSGSWLFKGKPHEVVIYGYIRPAGILVQISHLSSHRNSGRKRCFLFLCQLLHPPINMHKIAENRESRSV